MESSEQTGSYIYPPICTTKQADFWLGGFFHVVLSEYPSQSHHFTNLNFCDETLLFSISFYWLLVQKTGSKLSHGAIQHN